MKHEEPTTKKVALVVGATGITGSNLSAELLAQGWTSYGLARNPARLPLGVLPVQADLLDKAALASALQDIEPEALFITTWMRQSTEAENIAVNSALVRNVLDVLSAKRSLRHVALVTGLKHYLGPFEAYAKGALPQTPLRESQPRLDYPNFYYAQEDEVYAAAARDGFSWSIHRPHTVIGKAPGNLMNMGTTLAAYASICKAYGLPFAWPGSQAQWEGLSDVTDARILAKQMIWAAQTEGAKDTAFNIVNGDVFRWRELWAEIAAYFDVDYVGFSGTVKPLEDEMGHYGGRWKELAAKHGLQLDDLSQLASAWHTDLDLGRPIEVMTDMYNSRVRGFAEFQSTKQSFFDLFDRLREDRLIP